MPVVVPVTSSVAAPPGVPAGIVTSTDAVPYSSRMSVPIVLVTGNVPRDVPLRLTATVVSLASGAVDIASEVRSNVTCAPAAYDAGAFAGSFTPTARWL